MNIKTEKRRALTLTLGIVCVFFLFCVQLFRVSVLEINRLSSSAVSGVTVSVEPTRGEIFDRDGNPLVLNKRVNTIVFHYQTFPKSSEPEQRNGVILELIELFDKYDLQWRDELPIKLSAKGKLSFDSDRAAEVEYLKSSAFLDLNYYASVQNCFDALVERYSLESLSKKKARDVASVYYLMMKDGFNTSTPYIFADDVSDEVVAVIKENGSTYVGVDVQVRSEREYVDGTIAPHIIGIVGTISAEEYESMKSDGYKMTDVVGKNGIEYAMESQLRGQAGEKVIYTDSSGNTSEVITKQPVAGNNIILTIQKDLQLTAQKALEETIKELSKTNPDVKAGSVVVMSTENNDILAAANYPSFDLSTYYDEADELSSDENTPLWNRALRSVYTPGSTIKPAVAMAGLEQGVITGDTVVRCERIYDHYDDYKPRCTGYHRNQTVVTALFNSCNIFFYETARLLGIDRLNDYYTMFGLGEKTGVELSENAGTVDSPEHREQRGELWTPGLTIQAGIGHGDNQFTPLQLCVYASTLANRGVRYQAHLIRSVMSADYSETVSSRETKILSQANFKDENWQLVYRGMYLVGTESYADFSSVGETVAAKTGTTSVYRVKNGKSVEVNNGLMIAFAPYESPEICVSVVIEGASAGGLTAPIVSAIMQQYFKLEENEETAVQLDELL